MKRVVSTFLLIVIVIGLLPVTVFANSPAPNPWYWFDFTNLPEGTKYVDMLIELPEDDPNYVLLVSENLPADFSESSPIIHYCEKNFRSYTFHYANAKAMIAIDKEKAVYFFTDSQSAGPLEEHRQDIYKRGRIRLALLDESGNILQVSRTFSVKPQGIFDYQYNTFHYDAAEDSLEMDTRLDVVGMLVFIFLSIIGLGLTCVLEDAIAGIFKLRKQYGDLIFRTNFLSQILMRLLHILLYGWIFNQYIFTVVVLEILVYTGEFLFYRRKMKDISLKRVFWYTVTANTVSLAVSAIPMMIL